MNCPKCGAAAAEGDNFCEDCGASLKKAVGIDSNCEASDDVRLDMEISDPSLAAACSRGRVHPKNEDAGSVMRCNDGTVILVVCDGVSSAVNAVSAAVQAVDKVREALSGGHGNDMIKTAIVESNNLILSLPYETRSDGIYGPEATIVAALVERDTASIGWVGDSRAYIIGKEKEVLLTADDSWMALVTASGEMTREQAMKDKRAHYVTQVLGMHDQPMEVHTLKVKLEKGEILLLCTDGLWNYFQGDGELQKAVMGFGMERDAADICEYLVGFANEAGGHDNITAAIYKNV